MMKQKTVGAQLGSVLVISALLVALSGCEQQGPAEKAGEKMDDATERAGEKMEQAGEDLQDKAQGDK